MKVDEPETLRYITHDLTVRQSMSTAAPPQAAQDQHHDTPLQVTVRGSTIQHGDFLEKSPCWPAPTVIIVDGPYGISSFPGDPDTPDELPDWYVPYLARWSEKAMPCTTLWFWGTEIGWATMHPELQGAGWDYRACHVWDKGMAHIAGNANTKTLRRYPVVTEVCVQYVRKVMIRGQNLKDWVRNEWQRTKLPMYQANEACHVRNAATRKYLTKCHLWYFPPPDAFELMAHFANEHGDPAGRPYYSLDGVRPATGQEWSMMRAKFNCHVGINNVWREPAVRGNERVKNQQKALHANQKPLQLMERVITASSDPGDVVWEPFGGLCTAAVAAIQTGRRCYSAEINRDYYEPAYERLIGYA